MSAAVDRLAAEIAARRRVALAAALSTALPQAEVAVAGEDVVIAARGLAQRWEDEPALRWPAGVLA